MMHLKERYYNFFFFEFYLVFVLPFQLRLLYECIPMAYLVQQAGGLATNGKIPILDIIPESIHQRTPIFLGSNDDVNDVMEVIRKHS